MKDFYAKGKKLSQAIEIKDVDEIIEPTKSQEKKKPKSNFKFKKPKTKEVIENDESALEKERLAREAEATAAAASKDRIDLEEAIDASQQEKTGKEDQPASSLAEESKENDGKSQNRSQRKDSPIKNIGEKSSVEKIDSSTKSGGGGESATKKSGKQMKVAGNQSKLAFASKPTTPATRSTRQSKRQKTGE